MISTELTSPIARTLYSTFNPDFMPLTHDQKVELMFKQHKRYIEMGMVDAEQDWYEFVTDMSIFQSYKLTKEVAKHISQTIKLIELDDIL